MIEVNHLVKKYGDYMAVSDLSFHIEKGHIYGFLGPNGAGKSTTMNIITGCLAATSGEVTIGGFDIFEQPKQAKKLIGYLPELPPLYTDQTVREYLTFVAKAKKIQKKEVDAEVARVAEVAHVDDVIDKLIMHLSKGYRQRVGIAQALIGEPELIILDEPTVGLDPSQIIEIRELIKKLGENHTVILSSHILSEIQAVCDRVLIINHGKLVAFDEPDKLGRVLSGGNTIEICAEVAETELRELLASVNGINEIKVLEGDEVSCTAVLSVGENEPKEICREIYAAFVKAEKVILQLNPIKPTLEDIFLRITGEAAVADRTDDTDAEETLQSEPEVEKQ